MTYDGEQFKEYTNGQLINVWPATGAPIGTGEPMIVGAWPPYSAYNFDGAIDEFQIFNRALNSEEIQAMYDAGSAGLIKPQTELHKSERNTRESNGTIETFFLDTYSPGNVGYSGPVNSTTSLDRETAYVVEVQGTWSLFFPKEWGGVCDGSPEDGPQFPSLTVKNGLVGMDPAHMFAAPNGSGWCPGDLTEPLPVGFRVLQFSLDGGTQWFIPEPLDSTFNSDHLYSYHVEGNDHQLQARLVDSRTEDNYGQIRVSIRPIQTPPGLVARWSGDGNANDVVGGNHGRLLGGTSFAPGRVGEAFSFDGVDDFIEIDTQANLDVGVNSGFTIYAWILPKGHPKLDVGSGPIVEWDRGGPGCFCGVHLWQHITLPTDSLDSL